MKNDRGTYGLGIMVLTSGDAILNLSNRKINKLRYAKGGAAVDNYLIQEGIPTSMLTEEGEPVEPVNTLLTVRPLHGFTESILKNRTWITLILQAHGLRITQTPVTCTGNTHTVGMHSSQN